MPEEGLDGGRERLIMEFFMEIGKRILQRYSDCQVGLQDANITVFGLFANHTPIFNPNPCEFCFYFIDSGIIVTCVAFSVTAVLPPFPFNNVSLRCLPSAENPSGAGK